MVAVDTQGLANQIMAEAEESGLAGQAIHSAVVTDPRMAAAATTLRLKLGENIAGQTRTLGEIVGHDAEMSKALGTMERAVDDHAADGAFTTANNEANLGERATDEHNRFVAGENSVNAGLNRITI